MRDEQMALRARCAHPRGGFEPFPPEVVERSIPARFEERVARHPERLAVMVPGATLSYDQLNAAANRVAHALLARAGAGADPVGLLFANSPEFVAASIGALKAGKIQVLLDRDFPRARLAYMLEHSQARVIVTDGPNLPLARELAGPGGAIVDVGRVDGQPGRNPGVAIFPETLTSINYTSGSTGPPKGIVHSHRSVLTNVMRYVNAVRLGVEDRHAYPRISMVPTLYALLAGSAACLIDLGPSAIRGVADWLIEAQVTVCRSAVSGLRALLDALDGRGGPAGDGGFPDLRLVAAMGEAAYPADVERYRRHFSSRSLFVSSLGTRETGDYAYFFADRASHLPAGALPGGYVAADAAVHVLDDRERPVAEGEAGELAVRCGSAPVGYWRRPDLTAAALRPDPAGGPGSVYLTGDIGRRLPDGCLVHAGRRDFQVKIRGFRVDTGDVEHALLGVPGVRQAVVAGRDTSAGGQRLVAYVVPVGATAPSVPDLRSHLAATLAPHMIPTAFVTLAELPRTATGKIDRRALPPPRRARPDVGAEPVAPRGPLEALLAEVWADVLELDAVGVHDAFLDLGGDSLRANQVVARVAARLPLALSAAALFVAPTIADMAAVILSAGMDGGPDARALRAPGDGGALGPS